MYIYMYIYVCIVVINSTHTIIRDILLFLPSSSPSFPHPSLMFYTAELFDGPVNGPESALNLL